MGTRILKIDGVMPEINECKVGNPQISISRNWANLSQPWILTFFEDEIFNLFFQFHAPEMPEWKIALSLWCKKAQNTEKNLKIMSLSEKCQFLVLFWYIWLQNYSLSLTPLNTTWRQSASTDGRFDTHIGGFCQCKIFDIPCSGHNINIPEASALFRLGLGGWGQLI